MEPAAGTRAEGPGTLGHLGHTARGETGAAARRASLLARFHSRGPSTGTRGRSAHPTGPPLSLKGNHHPISLGGCSWSHAGT